MSPDALREYVAAQFSYRGTSADVWRLLDLLVDTDAHLNLGYSPWYLPHAVGSSQRRLATQVGRRVADQLQTTDGARVLDVGCGRGGPSVHLADRHGIVPVGLDLVPYNVARARAHAADRGAPASFVVGDAAQLPFPPGSFSACVAVDATVYIPDRARAFAEIADVLEPGGTFIFSDLVVHGDVDADARAAVSRFADTWTMPALGSRSTYEGALGEAGLSVRDVEDLTPHSVGRFRTWTALFGWLARGRTGRLLDRALQWYGLNPATVRDQVCAAHAALPSLRHVLFVATR